MKILTLGDSWTYGANEYGLDPAQVSWPAQMRSRYGVEVVNLAHGGCSIQRAMRIGIEELCRDASYDQVILPLGPAARTEVLKVGKWHQVWPNSKLQDPLNQWFTTAWHPWNDVQQLIMNCFYFMHSVHAMGIPLYITSLSVYLSQYTKEISWITDYQSDNDFNSLGIPLDEFDIGIKDLDRKLKCLKAIHDKNLVLQPDYFTDAIKTYYTLPETNKKYNYRPNLLEHPNENGYTALADYFANKIGLTTAQNR